MRRVILLVLACRGLGCRAVRKLGRRRIVRQSVYSTQSPEVRDPGTRPKLMAPDLEAAIACLDLVDRPGAVLRVLSG